MSLSKLTLKKFRVTMAMQVTLQYGGATNMFSAFCS
jgi:hypothetical protein